VLVLAGLQLSLALFLLCLVLLMAQYGQAAWVTP